MHEPAQTNPTEKKKKKKKERVISQTLTRCPLLPPFIMIV